MSHQKSELSVLIPLPHLPNPINYRIVADSG
jgi:hypothetical protein